MPNTRADPPEGMWKPSSVLMSVDFPAPFGPSSPIALPHSSPVRPSRTIRPPSRTCNPSSSMTLMSLHYAGEPCLVPGIHDRAQGEEVEAEQPAVARRLNAIVLPPRADHRWSGVGRELPDRFC